MSAFLDRTGKRYNRLIAIKRVASKSNTIWECLCDCGAIVLAAGGDLSNGHTKSCGCWRAEALGNSRRTHGGSNSKEHAIWRQMRQRCNNPKAKDYRYYGGQGVTVCERWKKFEIFYADMGPKPMGLTLDRINPFGNYEPSNCRWASRLVQSQNTRKRAISA